MFLTILAALASGSTGVGTATAAVAGATGGLAYEALKSLASGVIPEPAPGSVLYSAIVTGVAEHSGIYIGDGQIVHLNGDGKIEAVSAMTFLNRLGGFATGISLFASCDKNGPVGSADVAERAISMIGQSRDYGLLTDNCHQFSAGCLTGDFENSSNFLWMLKDQAQETLNATHWPSWTFDPEHEELRFKRAAPALKKLQQACAKAAATKTEKKRMADALAMVAKWDSIAKGKS